MGTRLTSRPNSSRRGCWTCKRHHRTCDETQPCCLRCKQYAVECEGYGAKRVAFRPANRTNATAKGRASQNASRSMTAVSYTAAFSPAASEYLPQSPKSPLPSPGILSPTTPIGRYQGPLLNQFICEFAPLRSLSPLENIFEEDIAPLALGYLHVRTAIIAVVSALKQTRGSAPRPQFRYNVDAFRHYEEAVRLLRQSVVRSGREKKALSSHHRNSAEETHACLAATYLLTWFEVLVYDPQKWVIHLKALCDLINRGDSSLVQTTFGRRLLHAVARLDCQNALSNRGQPLLEEYWYEMLGSNMRYMSITTADDGDSTGLTEAELEALAVENCRKLHGLLGAAAFLSFEWTSDTPLVANDSLKERVRDILRRLMLWYQMLPSALRWPEDIGNSPSDSATYDEDLHGEFCETDTTFAHDVPHDAIDSQLRKRSHLQKMILLHYYAIRVHLYHILDPVRDPRLMQLSINLAQKCLYVIRALENTPSFPTRRREEMVKEETPFTKFQTQLNTKPSQYPSDMPVSFVFACIGVVLRDPSQREWISEYLMQLGREGIWCGYERALCLHAWWRSDNTISKLKEESSITKRLIKSIPHRHEVPIGSVTTWTPDMGMGVDIMYEILETGEIGFDRYHFSAYMQSQIGKKGP